MKATVLVNRNPLQQASGRQVFEVRGKKRKLSRYAPRTILPTICSVNGAYISRKDWRYRRIHDGDIVQFHILPQGGGNGGKILRTVATLAVLYFAPQLAAQTNLGLFASGSSLAFAVPTGVIAGAYTIAGLALINAMMPPPKLPSQNYRTTEPASPTYNVSAQGNIARLGEAIPVQYGRHIAYPDYAAEPYAEFVGNEQYLYQLFCLGQGYYDIEAMRLEDTALSTYTDAAYEIVEPGGSVSLFPTNVVNSIEVAGVEVPGALSIPITASQSGSTLTIAETSHGRTAGQSVEIISPLASAGSVLSVATFTVNGVYTIQTTPTADTYTITISGGLDGATYINGAVYRAVPPVGPYVATSAGVEANYIAVDMVCPRGLYYTSDDGSLITMSAAFRTDARLVDDSGAPLGTWFTLGTENIAAATTTVQRRSYRYAVTDGRYEVRITRVDVQNLETRAGHVLAWAGLRAYIPGTQQYGDVTMIAVRLKATSELSQAASRKFNVIATRKLPIWDGTTWSAPTATRSIAWAFADAARNTGYGLSLADSRIPLADLLTLDATWTSRGDYFDARFDSTVVFWEAAQRIARAGRAKPYIQGGALRIWRDQEQAAGVAMFTPRNTLPNSLNVTYLAATDETADAVEVEYFNADKWTPETVVASLPDSTAAKPVKVQLFGVTGHDQAWREGMYMAACNRYRRKMLTRSTEMEGFIPSLGDLVIHSDKRLSNAQSGELIGWNGATLTATVSEPLTFSAATAVVYLRKRDGSPSGPYTVVPGALPSEMVFGSAPDFSPYVGSREERTAYSFGTAVESRIAALVMSSRPSGNTVEMSFVAEYYDGSDRPYVHYADTGTPPAQLEAWQLPRIFTPPSTPSNVAISETLVNLSNIVRVRMDVSWDYDSNAEGYRVAWRQGSGNWNQLPDTAVTTVSVIDAPLGDVEVRVVAFASARESDPTFVTATILGKMALPGDVTSFRISNGVLSWQGVSDIDIAGYEVRFNYGTNTWWDGATPMHSDLISASPWAPNNTPSGSITLLIKAKDTSGNYSANASYIIVDLGDQTVVNLLLQVDEHTGFAGIKTNCTVVSGELVADAIDVFYGAANEAFYGSDSDLFYPTATYDTMRYEWDFDVPVGLIGSGNRLVLLHTIAGAFAIEHQRDNQELFYGVDGDYFYGADADPFFGEMTGWQAWLGSIEVSGIERVYFRVTIQAGSSPGTIATLSSLIDVPDVIETVDDFVVGSGGARLPLTKIYRVIKNIQITIQDDGHNAVNVKIMDKNATLGPLVQGIDAANLPVQSLVDATVQGY